MPEQRQSFKDLLLAALISSTLASAVVGIVFTRYVAAVQEEVKSQRAWKEKSVAELLGPMSIQLDRTKGALNRWTRQNLEHYDVWLELYEKHRGGKEPDLDEPFVFAAPAGFRFPKEAEEHFKERLRLYMKELYGV